jgi:hypothetical protein
MLPLSSDLLGSGLLCSVDLSFLFVFNFPFRSHLTRFFLRSTMEFVVAAILQLYHSAEVMEEATMGVRGRQSLLEIFDGSLL